MTMIEQIKENINPILLDGNIHRFKGFKENTGWYIGNDHPKLGKILTVGDWVLGEKQTFRDNAPLTKPTREESRVLQEHLEASRKAKEDQQKNISAQSIKKIEELKSIRNKTQNLSQSKYLNKKGLTTVAASYILQHEGNIFVSCQDVDGHIWGYQTIIDETGDKFFATGQRVSGTFHELGTNIKDASSIYICEGFATGLSILLAMPGSSVVCAFSAGNIVTVAKDLSAKYPNKIFIICGDEDAYGTTNAGRKYAEEASVILGTKPIFPKFKTAEGKPTDFNDLLVLEGLEEVKKQISSGFSKQEKDYIPLGFDGSTHYWYLGKSRTIFATSSYQEERVFTMMPKEKVEALYSKDNGKINWSQLKNDLTQLQVEAGPFKPTKIRGLGVWKDGHQYVYNSNKGVLCNEPEKLGYHYISGQRKMPELGHMMDLDGEILMKAIDRIPFEKPSDRMLFAGWLVIARVASALDIRPHLWVTGPSGCGKSTIFNKLVQPLLGSGGCRVDIGTTAAGIRQEVGKDGVCVVFDEFEIGEKTQEFRRIQELMRISWRKGGSLKKGTPSGATMEYPCNSPFILGSIRVHFETEADESRFSVIALKRVKGALPEEFLKIDKALGDRIFSTAFKNIQEIQQAAVDCRTALASCGLDNRRSDHIGTMLAGYAFLLSDNFKVSQSCVAQVVTEYLNKSDDLKSAKSPEKDDAILCLNHLLGSQTYASRKSVVELFHESTIKEQDPTPYDGDPNTILQRLGMKRVGDRLHVAFHHPELKKIFSGTHWHTWSNALLRVEGAEKTTCRILGVNLRSVSVQLDT